MLKLLKKPQHEQLAANAAKETSPKGGVGKFLGAQDEEPNVVSYRFEANLKGYVGWEWNVVVFQAKKSNTATVSEVLLLPGKKAIVAPAWVPWSDRRAELEKSLVSDSAISDLEVAEQPQGDSEDAGERPPIRKRLAKRLIKKQDGNKGRKPRKSSK